MSNSVKLSMEKVEACLTQFYVESIREKVESL